MIGGIGSHLVNEVRLATHRIAIFPDSCQEVAPGVRRCLVRRFPYSLIYCDLEEEILVLAVAHQHRKPRYWQGRLDTLTQTD